MSASIVERIQRAVETGLPDDRTLLAVSGGIDSMVMMHAAARVLPAARLFVATFDHASGPHTAPAVDLVERAAMSLGLAVVVGKADPAGRSSEADWRESRMSFLNAAAFEHGAAIATAHTSDDQVETVLFRELRGSGPRGLAGLAAESPLRRPLLGVSRAEVSDYARLAGVEWIDDPTNADRQFARSRIRHELIPALRSVHPRIESDLADIGRRAARWRADVDQVIDARIEFDVDAESETLEVSRGSLAGHSDESLGIIWPALLARLGIAADWRGTRRLVAFTTRGSTGQRIQLSGGWTVHRRRGAFEVRRDGPTDQ
jgi:tRNA(Ile)-lysidine synthase